jgi:hypothetical protein
MNAKDFYNEVSNMIKAIGTSSSANEERDERSVENYVRQSANTNTNYQIGGNTMSNTTEPDPQGDIAVQKSFPTPNAGDLVNQTTRPEGDVSVSDAPNNPGIVPNNETFPGEGSAIAPTHAEMAEPVEKAEAGKCASCGQALPVAKADEPKDADEITKSAACADCGKSMDLCDCMGKAVDEKETAAESAKETAADEKAEMKKSLWGGAFAPIK